MFLVRVGAPETRVRLVEDEPLVVGRDSSTNAYKLGIKNLRVSRHQLVLTMVRMVSSEEEEGTTTLLLPKVTEWKVRAENRGTNPSMVVTPQQELIEISPSQSRMLGVNDKIVLDVKSMEEDVFELVSDQRTSSVREVQTTMASSPPPAGSSSSPSRRVMSSSSSSRTRSATRHAVLNSSMSVSEMMDKGLLREGEDVFVRVVGDKEAKGQLLTDGRVRMNDDREFESLSEWAFEAKREVDPNFEPDNNSNAWWMSVIATSSGKTLAEIRDTYMSSSMLDDVTVPGSVPRTRSTRRRNIKIQEEDFVQDKEDAESEEEEEVQEEEEEAAEVDDDDEDEDKNGNKDEHNEDVEEDEEEEDEEEVGDLKAASEPEPRVKRRRKSGSRLRRRENPADDPALARAIKLSSSLRTLIDSGIMTPGTRRLVVRYRGRAFWGDLDASGIVTDVATRTKYTIPSRWSLACKRTRNPKLQSDSGWTSVFVRDDKDNTLKPLKAVRKLMITATLDAEAASSTVHKTGPGRNNNNNNNDNNTEEEDDEEEEEDHHEASLSKSRRSIMKLVPPSVNPDSCAAPWCRWNQSNNDKNPFEKKRFACSMCSAFTHALCLGLTVTDFKNGEEEEEENDDDDSNNEGRLACTECLSRLLLESDCAGLEVRVAGEFPRGCLIGWFPGRVNSVDLSRNVLVEFDPNAGRSKESGTPRTEQWISLLDTPVVLLPEFEKLKCLTHQDVRVRSGLAPQHSLLVKQRTSM